MTGTNQSALPAFALNKGSMTMYFAPFSIASRMKCMVWGVDIVGSAPQHTNVLALGKSASSFWVPNPP